MNFVKFSITYQSKNIDLIFKYYIAYGVRLTVMYLFRFRTLHLFIRVFILHTTTIQFVKMIILTLLSCQFFGLMCGVSVSQPVDQLVDQSVGQSVSRPVGQSTSRPVSQSISWAISQSISRPVSQSTSWAVSQSASQVVWVV